MPEAVVESVALRANERERADARDATYDEAPGRREGERPGVPLVEPDAPASWVDAVVTLLAIVIFGLGWALFELNGAEQAMRDYDLPRAETRLAALAPDAAAGAPGALPHAEIPWTIGPNASSGASSTR